jgi:hypothetical protein
VETIQKAWRLRSDLPELFDICHWPSHRNQSGEAVVHTPTCHLTHWPRGDGWTTQVPLAVVLQLWPTVTPTSSVMFCQLCVIEEEKWSR